MLRHAYREALFGMGWPHPGHKFFAEYCVRFLQNTAYADSVSPGKSCPPNLVAPTSAGGAPLVCNA